VERDGSESLALVLNSWLRCRTRCDVRLLGTAPHDNRLCQPINKARHVTQGSDPFRCRKTQFVPLAPMRRDGVIAEFAAKAPDHFHQQAPVAGDGHGLLLAGRLVLCGCGDEEVQQGVHAVLSFLAP
jgi:hypothetical protein